MGLRVNKKSKVAITLNAFGVILDNDNGLIKARIYDSTTYEIIDDITFSSTEFIASERNKLESFLIFTWRVGYIGSKPFSNIRLKKAKPKCGLRMTKEESMALSLKCFHSKDNTDNYNFIECE